MILHCWETTASWQVVRWLVPADDVLAQTISHAPLAAFTSVPGPHGLQVAGGGGEGDGGGGEGEGDAAVRSTGSHCSGQATSPILPRLTAKHQNSD